MRHTGPNYGGKSCLLGRCRAAVPPPHCPKVVRHTVNNRNAATSVRSLAGTQGLEAGTQGLKAGKKRVRLHVRSRRSSLGSASRSDRCPPVRTHWHTGPLSMAHRAFKLAYVCMRTNHRNHKAREQTKIRLLAN